MRVLCAALFGVTLSGCALPLSISQCNTDSDCPAAADGSKLSCTTDHLCVAGTPAALLCPQSAIFPTPAAPGAIPIGLIEQSPSDPISHDAVELAVNDAIASSGIPFVVHYCDSSRDTPTDASKAAGILINERHVVGIIGPSFSSEVLAVAPVVGAAQVPLVSPSATATSITSLSTGHPYLFRVVASDSVQAKVLAGLVAAVKPANGGIPNVAVINVNDAYGNGLQSDFTAALGSAGKLVAVPTFPEGNSQGISAAVAQVLNAMPDAVVAIATADAPALLYALAPLPSAVKIYTTDGAKDPSVLPIITMTPPAGVSAAAYSIHLQRINGTAPYVDESAASVFPLFAAQLQGAPYNVMASNEAFSAYAYDAFWALAMAAGAAQSTGAGATSVATGVQVMHALARITTSGSTVTVGGSNLLAAIKQLSGQGTAQLHGTSGTINFDGNGDRPDSPYEIWGLDVSKGAFSHIASANP